MNQGFLLVEGTEQTVVPSARSYISLIFEQSSQVNPCLLKTRMESAKEKPFLRAPKKCKGIIGAGR